jgi:hypothetical protein
MKSVKDKLVRELSRLNVQPGGKKSASALHSLAPFQQIARLSSSVNVDVHEALCTLDVFATIIAMTGRTPFAEQGSQPLLSLGHQGSRSLNGLTLNGLNWHVDIALKPGSESPGIQAFYLIDDVVPQGGATLALARSHSMRPESLLCLRAAMKQAADVHQALLDFDVEVVEMSGRAGDVYLMDMRVLHTPSVNCSPNIRMMATTRFGFRA